MLTFLSSIFSGGLTGILGIIVQRFFDHQNKKLDIEINKGKYAHELELRQVDAEIMRQEWAQREKVTALEVEGKSDVAASAAFSASFNEPVRYSDEVKATQGQGWALITLDIIRGLIRPVLTVYLCVLTTLIYFHASELMDGMGAALETHHAVDLMKLVISTVLYLTTTCVLWWFGTRNKQKPPEVKRS